MAGADDDNEDEEITDEDEETADDEADTSFLVYKLSRLPLPQYSNLSPAHNMIQSP